MGDDEATPTIASHDGGRGKADPQPGLALGRGRLKQRLTGHEAPDHPVG